MASLDSKRQHSGKTGANTQVDDGAGKETTVRSCVKTANTQVDDGTGKGTTVRSCVKAANTVRANCITCNMVPRKQGSDKFNPCQLAVFFST